MKEVVKTLRVLKMIEELAAGMKCGIVPFSEISQDEPDCGRIVYDDKDGTLVRDDDIFEYPVVLNSVLAIGHHDIVSTYDDYSGGVTVRLHIVPVEESDDDVTIIVRFDDCSETVEISDDGRWELREPV